MKLLTFEAVEEMVKKRVAKKAGVFGQEVTLNDSAKEVKGKVDPSLVSRLYDEWIMPLTKLVEVEYLLRRLDQIVIVVVIVFTIHTMVATIIDDINAEAMMIHIKPF